MSDTRTRSIVMTTINAQGVSDGNRTTADNVIYRAIGADITITQETAGADFRKLLDQQLVGVHQDMTNEGSQSGAILWSKNRFDHLGGDRILGTAANEDGHRIYARWLVYSDLVVDGRLAVRFATGHRPPGRYASIIPNFDAAVSQLFATSPWPVVLGIDTNHGAPATYALGRHRDARWMGEGIDGFIYSSELALERVGRLRKSKSDHFPFAAELVIPDSIRNLRRAGKRVR